MADARETAQIALRVLHGEKPESIPVATVDSYAYQFDSRQLQRWRISEALLPTGSVIRYRELSCRKIVDSGVGFDPIAIDHGGLGLLSMRERVGILRGKLVINASPGQGTRIGVSIPVSPSSEGRTPFASV